MALSCIMILPALTVGLNDAEAATRELSYGEFGPNRGTRAGALKWLDQEMRKRSNNELGLNITWGGALLGAKTAAQGLSDGLPTWPLCAGLCAGHAGCL